MATSVTTASSSNPAHSNHVPNVSTPVNQRPVLAHGMSSSSTISNATSNILASSTPAVPNATAQNASGFHPNVNTSSSRPPNAINSTVNTANTHPTSPISSNANMSSHRPTNPNSSNATQQTLPSVNQNGSIPVWKQPAAQDGSPEEWIPASLATVTLLALAAVNIGFIVALVVLVMLSRQRNGFVPVSSTSTTILNFDISVDLAWTTLPTFIMSAYSFWFVSTVNACADRQPYVELYPRPAGAANTDGARVKQSLLLNYSSCFPGKTVFMAIKRRHPLLVFGFFLVLVVSFVLPALASHLFSSKLTSKSDFVSIYPSTSFDDFGITTRTDIILDFDAAAATLVAGSAPIPWTTLYYSFQRFFQPSHAVANVTANVQATSATLNCAVINPNLLVDNGAHYNFEFDDRGCVVKGNIAVIAYGDYDANHVQLFSNLTCGGGSAGYTRFASISYHEPHDQTTITNKVIISCEPSYHNHTGVLQVDYSDLTNGQPHVIDFDTTGTFAYDPFRPVFAGTFEKQLDDAQVFQTSNPDSSSDFGRLVSTYGQKIQGSGPLSEDTVRNATAQVFTTLYAFTSAQNVWTTSSKVIAPVDGSVITIKLRLFTYEPLIWASIGIFALVLIFLLCAYLYRRTHRSVLYEDPGTIMGAFALSRNNQFIQEVIKSGHANIANGKVWEGLENPQGMTPWWKLFKLRSATGIYSGFHTRLSLAPSAMKQGWYMEVADDAKTMHIGRTEDARKPRWKDSFTSNYE